MSLINRSRLEIKLGDYATGTVSALTDANLVTVAQDYKRHTASRMIPLEARDIRKRFPSADYHVSLKIDGEFNILVYADGEILTVNPGGTVRTGLPFLKEAAERLKEAGVKKATFAGELYCVRTDGKRPRVHDVSRVARQPASKAELDQLRFAPFDIIDLDGAAPSAPSFRATWEKLTGLFGGSARVELPEAVWVKDGADIERKFEQWIEGGSEGLVVRSDTVGMFKIKPRHTLDAVIIGFTEGTEDDRKGMIHDLLMAVMRADGTLHVLGHVGGGFTEDERRGFLSDLRDRVVASDYVEVNDQVAYHMVRPESVIEISVLDTIAQTTRGQPINRMVLHWNAAANKYEIVRRLPLVALISPQFIRRREDKRVHPIDIRIAQVSDLVEVALVDRDARQLNLTGSKVLRREVYTKQLKGATMVRKFVLWETNKAQDMDEFPAYVLHFTDFSPNRATMLDRDIRVSSSREQIDTLWNDLVAENITKGWVKEATSSAAMPASPPPAPVVPAAPIAASPAWPSQEAESPAPTPVGEQSATKKRGKAAAPAAESAPTASTASSTDAGETKPAPKKRAASKKKTDE